MSSWRRKAIEFLPEMKQLIETSETPGELWRVFYPDFVLAVELKNQEFIDGVLEYLAWCTSEAAGRTSSNIHLAASSCFLENIGRNQQLWPYLNAWFSKAQFEQYKSAICSGISQEKIEELESIFYKG